MSFEIVKASHTEFLVTDLNKAYEFYVETLGFYPTYADEKHLYLRGMEDRFHHCLVLTKSDKPGVKHIAYKVSKPEDLEKLEKFFIKKEIEVAWIEKDYELGQGKALRIQDPLGFPVEFFYEMQRVDWFLQKYHLYKGAKILRLDHFNVQVPDVEFAYNWYVNELNFKCIEITETEDIPPKIWAAWLRRKHTTHDIALMTGIGPRVHHVAFSVPDRVAIMDCSDILASKDLISSMERGPGRHGITNAFFLYLRDNDGNRIELYTGDYLTADPDWEPIKWKLNDPKRQTFWGAPAPKSWFDEAMLVKSIKNDSFIEVKKPKIQDKPSYITGLH